MSIIPRDPKYTSDGEYSYKYIATAAFSSREGWMTDIRLVIAA
ncbi:MAG: hypothetical protein WC926_01430 [Candidatus Paceibacterota bacterium]